MQEGVPCGGPSDAHCPCLVPSLVAGQHGGGVKLQRGVEVVGAVVGVAQHTAVSHLRHLVACGVHIGLACAAERLVDGGGRVDGAHAITAHELVVQVGAVVVHVGAEGHVVLLSEGVVVSDTQVARQVGRGVLALLIDATRHLSGSAVLLRVGGGGGELCGVAQQEIDTHHGRHVQSGQWREGEAGAGSGALVLRLGLELMHEVVVGLARIGPQRSVLLLVGVQFIDEGGGVVVRAVRSLRLRIGSIDAEHEVSNLAQSLVQVEPDAHALLVVATDASALVGVVARDVVGGLPVAASDAERVAVIDVVAQQFVKPVGVDAAQRVELRLSGGDELWQLRVVGVVLVVVVGAVAVARCFGVLQQALQFQLLGRVHHANAATSASGHTHVGRVVDGGRALIATL